MSDKTSIEEQFRHINPVPDPFNPPMSTPVPATTRLGIEESKVTEHPAANQPSNTEPRRPLLLTAGVAIVVVLVAGLFALFPFGRDGADVADDTQTGVFATSIDHVAGRWRGSEFPWYIELTNDGTHQYGVDEERLEANLAGKPDGAYWFEGNLVYVESSDCRIRGNDEPGVYHVRLITRDVIQFEPVEETCENRRTSFAVDSVTYAPVTWSRVR